MSFFIASQYPPPENRFGGAAATATRTACIVARTWLGQVCLRKARPGNDSSGSSSRWRLKKTISWTSSEDGRDFIPEASEGRLANPGGLRSGLTDAVRTDRLSQPRRPEPPLPMASSFDYRPSDDHSTSRIPWPTCLFIHGGAGGGQGWLRSARRSSWSGLS